MGLTGVIVSARIRLRAVGGPLVSVDTDRVDSLDAALAALASPGGAHRVAWLDLLSRRLVRGIVTRAEHADASRTDADATVRARATVPRLWPGGLLRPPAVGAFNAMRYRTAPRHERGRLESIGRHMFPLDSLDAWPRLYGPPGLLQYQLVSAGRLRAGARGRDRTSAPGPRTVLSRGAQGLRPRQRRAAVVPARGVDARARPPAGRARDRAAARRIRPARSRTRGGAST